MNRRMDSDMDRILIIKEKILELIVYSARRSRSMGDR